MQVAALTEAHAGCGAAAATAAREAAALRQKAAQLAADRLQAAANLRRAENEARAKVSGAAHCFCGLPQWPCSARRALEDLLGRQTVRGVSERRHSMNYVSILMNICQLDALFPGKPRARNCSDSACSF